MKQHSYFTKIFIAIGLLLIIYGYLCRKAEIYFFWESRYIGWGLFWIGTVSFLITQGRIKKAANKKNLLENIGIAVIIFILCLSTGLYVWLPFTDAYPVAAQYILLDPQVEIEIGTLKQYVLLPKGSYSSRSDTSGIHKYAQFTFIIKGERKYEQISITTCFSPPDYRWKVIAIQ